MEDKIFDTYFNLSDDTRLHKSYVMDVFNKYKKMSMKAIVKFLGTKNVEYAKNLRCYGSDKMGVFVGIELKKTRSTQRKLLQEIAVATKSLELQKYKTEEIGFSGAKLSEATLKLRRDRLNKLDILNINYDDFEDIIKKVTDESKSWKTKIASIDSILWKLWLAKNENLDLREKLITIRKEWIKEYDNERCKNKLNDKEKNNWIDWEDVLKIRDELKKLKQKLILGLYTYQPPRRLVDYSEMYYVNNFNAIIEEKNKNYCVGCHTFIFNRYKTFKTYGRQEINIDDNLSKLIKRYVRKYKIEDRELLVGDMNIAQILKHIFDKNVGVNILRKSYLSWICKPQISELEKQDIATLMAHSVKEASRYMKIVK